MKSIILESAAVLTPLGTTTETFSALCDGSDAVANGPHCLIDTPAAPFLDTKNRSVVHCMKNLWAEIPEEVRHRYKSQAGFLFAAAKGDISAYEMTIAEGKKADLMPLLDTQERAICEALAIHPLSSTAVSNACSSGAIGLEIAREWLLLEEMDRVIVCGFDCISRFVLSGFLALGALSPTRARPFDSHRDGLHLGEAGAIACIKKDIPVPGDICIAGTGTSNDANHRTGPSRTGDGLARAAQRALDDAGLSPSDIGAVKCHGTATPYNDAMEAKALYQIFKDSCPPCISMKGALGHTSGGGALAEIILSARALAEKYLPPTVGYTSHGVDEPLGIRCHGQAIEKPAMLCLSAGFGGVNAAVVITEVLS